MLTRFEEKENSKGGDGGKPPLSVFNSPHAERLISVSSFLKTNRKSDDLRQGPRVAYRPPAPPPQRKTPASTWTAPFSSFNNNSIFR